MWDAMLDHSLTLSTLTALTFLLIAARCGGVVAKKLNLPSVIGEILAGIAIGPGVLGEIFPTLYLFFFPPTQALQSQLQGFSLIGVLILLFVTGLEVDTRLIRQTFRQSFFVATVALSSSLTAGFYFASIIPENFFPNQSQLLASHFVVAISMSICAIPILARVLIEENIIRRSLSQVTLATAMVEDITGWVLLAAATALANDSGGISAGFSALLKTALIAIIILTIGRYIANRLLDISFHRGGGPEGSLVLAIIGVLMGAILSESAHLEPLPGAFLFGIVFGLLPRFDRSAQNTLESLTSSVCAPLFFAIAGQKVQIIHLLDPSIIGFVALMPLVSMASQGLGSFLVNRFIFKREIWSAAFCSCGLLSQGSIGVVIANIALENKLVSSTIYSMMVISAITTSCIGPAFLRRILKNLPIDPDDELRLKKEEASKNNLLEAAQRILVPVRTRVNAEEPPRLFSAHLIERICQSKVRDITLLTTVTEEDKSDAETFLRNLSMTIPNASVNTKIVLSDRPGDTIIEEALKGYDLVVLGTPSTTTNSTNTLFTPLIDHIIRFSPCPVFLTKGNIDFPDKELQKVLVPTNGSLAAKRAAEVAFKLVDPCTADILILKVIGALQHNLNYQTFKRQHTAGHGLVEDLKESASLLGISARTEIKQGAQVDQVILETAREEKVDLIVLGTNVRIGSPHLYLGPRVEKIVSASPCPVLIVNS
jgi:Kef-type K+ transport system membrane component KefB/nucleotide-binding universal stress UspA family protein